jgi:hypothetical protein
LIHLLKSGKRSYVGKSAKIVSAGEKKGQKAAFAGSTTQTLCESGMGELTSPLFNQKAARRAAVPSKKALEGSGVII